MGNFLFFERSEMEPISAAGTVQRRLGVREGTRSSVDHSGRGKQKRICGRTGDAARGQEQEDHTGKAIGD